MRYVIYTLLVVFAASCTQTPNAEIESAERLIPVDADSAIIVLSSIRQGELSAYDDALSAVVLTRAMLNRGDIVTCDSLIKPAYSYLLNRGTTQHKALATYCYAKIMSYTAKVKEATGRAQPKLHERQVMPKRHLNINEFIATMPTLCIP
ncbi:MAG: hypothetical protein R3Y49_07740 [Rikenellaceae bacterium]